MIHELYYVTSNKGKYEMAKNFLADHSHISLIQSDIHLSEEQNLDLQAIAISKAQQAWKILKKPLLVDDSGIYFNRYNQFPGFMTKFIYHALGFEGLYRLYDEGDSASFITYLVFMYDENKYQVFEGNVEGTLIKPDLAHKDFNLPYTHLMIPKGSTQTLHESMVGTGYSLFNPRIMALQKFVEYCNAQNS